MRDLSEQEDAALQASVKRQLDRDDLQREVSGQEAGRMQRFLSPDDPRSHASKKKAARDRAFRTLLDQLMEDPAYRALYLELGDKLSAAEIRADTALALIQEQMRLAKQEIKDMEHAAAKGPDGQPVFRFADGRVVDANGEELPPEIAAGIQWPVNAPSADAYFAALSRRDALSEQLDALQLYRHDVLGGIRDRYDDHDNPMSKDDLKRALEDIEAKRPVAVSLETATPQQTQLSADPTAFPSFN